MFVFELMKGEEGSAGVCPQSLAVLTVSWKEDLHYSRATKTLTRTSHSMAGLLLGICLGALGTGGRNSHLNQ